MPSRSYMLFTFIFISLFNPIWSELKRCIEKPKILEICLRKEEMYKNPFPVVVNSDLYFKEIIDIDQDHNSISIQVDLWTYWNDGSLVLSNTSET